MKIIIINTLAYLLGITTILLWGGFSSVLDAAEIALVLSLFFMLGYFIVILVLFLYRMFFSRDKMSAKWLGYTLVSFILSFIVLNMITSIFFRFTWY